MNKNVHIVSKYVNEKKTCHTEPNEPKETNPYK